jgi:hypothetical protein
MFFKAAIDGSLTAILKAQTDGVKKIVQDSVKEAAEALKQELRSQTRSAQLGDKLANTWRSAVYPKNKNSLEAAGTVYSKSPHIHRAYLLGSVIRGKYGKFLAIPTAAAPKRINGKKPTPHLYESFIGELFLIKKTAKLGFLIAKDQRQRKGKRGGFTKASDKQIATGRGLASVIMFILVPIVRVQKRIDLPSAISAAESFLVNSLKARLEQIPERQ